MDPFAYCRSMVNAKKKKKIDILALNSYKRQDKKIIAPTLQGSAFVARREPKERELLLIHGFIRTFNLNTNDIEKWNDVCDVCHNWYGKLSAIDVVIKTSKKKLHRQQCSKNGACVKDDIIREAQIMSKFMKCNAPPTIIRYYDFLEDDDSYYLIMEKGGKALFEFVVDCHQLIMQKKLSIKDWKNYVRFMFAKMVSGLDWFHNKMKCGVLDISLENFVMRDDTDSVSDKKIKQKNGCFENLGIRFIDFGLSELFEEQDDFLCDSFVGKTGYKAPEVIRHTSSFQANKADVFSLGVCLFMMSFGAPPFRMASTSDASWRLLKKGDMKTVLKAWNRLHYVGVNQYDLMMKMMCADETQRPSIDDVMQHEWIKSYFVKDELGMCIISNKNAVPIEECDDILK